MLQLKIRNSNRGVTSCSDEKTNDNHTAPRYAVRKRGRAKNDFKHPS